MADASGYFFNANIGFVEPNISDRDDCGGIVEVSPSQLSAIHSPRYPEEYPRGSECEWLLKAPAGYYLIYTIKDYRTPNAHPQKSERRWTPTKMDNLTCQHPLPMIEGALTIYGGKDMLRYNNNLGIAVSHDSGIYLRIDELTNRGISKKYRGDMVAMVQGNSYIDIQLDSGQVTTREVKGPYLGGLGTTHEEFRAKSEIRLGFVRRNALLVTRISLAYSTITTRCGGEINARDGLIGNPDIIDDFDCVWTIRENPGNLVRVSVS
uniref:CUB domain-containing protein n=1 Tax=Heterorhabditis bacteriophora TaxID=37862 RepID=A0A1I7X8W6_HETBA